ncbi:MAG: aminoglycoside phosphotransferase [Chloroflexi bacterium]|nr:MAG: aminoglycoside phosphotransferase [Chloroflexota bacterium]
MNSGPTQRTVLVIELETVAQQFVQHASVYQVASYGAGNVNDTFLVTLSTQEPAIQADRFVLQRINQHVFRQPDLILVNMRIFTDAMRAQLARETQDGQRRWEVPLVISTRHGQDYWVDEAGGFWRAISLIERAKTYARIRDAAHAREAGYALGRFHRLISDLDPGQLHDTLPGFHITPNYLAEYDRVMAQFAPAHGAQNPAVAYGQAFVAERRHWATVLEEARSQGRLALRTMHGDPKVDNILIDDVTGQAVSIIDLDTVKPGLVHYDIGDCLRSCCNPAGEETTDLSSVVFDLDLCRDILTGYLNEAARFFMPYDYAHLYDAIRLITFELGLRFFTDHLAGDRYFKVRHPQHNLDRALVQFRLLEQIEAQEEAIRTIVDELTPTR